MIPNFKTYIKESVWGDLHGRGIGELEREEDKGRINLLDKDEFFKYIKSNYEVFGTNSIIEYTDKRFIVIPILKEPHNGIIKKIYIDLSFGIIVIYFWVSKPLEKLLKSKYKISKLAGPHWIIEQEERDWNRLNEFYIDVIDTLITFDPSVLRKKGINESVWGDLHSRGIGETEREEDDVNLLDREGLLDYLKSHYSIDGDSINPTLHSIEVPVLKPAFLDKNGWATYVSLDYTPDGKKEVTILDDFPEYFEYVFKRLKKEYPIYHNSGVSFVIQPKSAKEECTNKFFIEVIDFIINTAKRELVIKKI